MYPYGLGWRYAGVDYDKGVIEICPFGVPGDRLYISERVEVISLGMDWCRLRYLADDDERRVEIPERIKRPKIGLWRGRVLPHEWARDLIENENVRAERFQDISSDDAAAEGIGDQYDPCSNEVAKVALDGTMFEGRRDWFAKLWDSINAKRGHPWSANDWVWVLAFKRLQDSAEVTR